nr:hypothetical protein KPHV_84980 [Kitasatospora purpeofusca]
MTTAFLAAQLAADINVTPGAVLGTIGTGGAALSITTFLAVGISGKGRIEIKDKNVPTVGFTAGYLYSLTTSLWTTPRDVTQAMVTTLQSAPELGGTIGPAAIGLVIIFVIYGIKPRPWLSAALSISLFTVATITGGIWNVPSVLLGALFGQVLGIHP